MALRRKDASGRLRLAIADIGFELLWEGTQLAEEPAWKFYEPFTSNGQGSPRTGRLDVRLHVHCGELPALKPDALIFDAVANHWRLFRVNGRSALEVFDTLAPHPKLQVAIMAPDFRSGEVHRRPDKNLPRNSWSLVQLMRPFGELLMVNLLSQGHGVLTHALGINDHGQGLLFVGASGAGKTTLAELYQRHSDATVLGDERVVVTQAGGQFWLSGTPWPGGGFTVSADTVPLRKVFFLEHGARNTLIADRHLTLYGLLFQQIFLPFWNREGLGFAMRFAHELLSALPAHRLAFINDATVIEFLRAQA
jgi:hypothetical protein